MAPIRDGLCRGRTGVEPGVGKTIAGSNDLKVRGALLKKQIFCGPWGLRAVRLQVCIAVAYDKQ